MQKCDVSNEDACIIQITDCHLLAQPGQRLRAWDNWAALREVLADVQRKHPAIDALLLTGDLVHDESPSGYQRLADLLQEFAVPIYAIPGNHDSPSVMAQAMQNVQVGGWARVRGWQIILLDSHIDSTDCGALGEQQLARLDSRLQAPSQSNTLLAVHHPPAVVGSPWIDALGLRDGAQLLRIAHQHAQVKAIICGHVHQACDMPLGSLRLLTTPAVTRQFLPGSQTPAEDRQRVPGYRCLHLSPDGLLRSVVHRVPAARQAGLK